MALTSISAGERRTTTLASPTYRVERCDGVCVDVGFVKIASPTTTSFNDSGLSPNTTYSYIVRAEDAAGNLGPYSNVATVTTGSTVPELVAAYAFDETSGPTVIDASGNGLTRNHRQRDTHHRGQVRIGADVQRDQRESQHSGRGFPASVDGDDARGVGQSDSSDHQLARRHLQGERQLLPDGDDGPERQAGGRRNLWNDRLERLRAVDPSRQHLEPPGGDVRRRDAAPLRQRYASRVGGSHRRAGDVDEPARDRWRQHLRTILPRARSTKFVFTTSRVRRARSRRTWRHRPAGRFLLSTLSPSSLNFGNVATGSTSAGQNVTLTNVGRRHAD